MMLILYVLVLAHTVVAHQYDCEILDGLIPQTDNVDNPYPTGLHKTDLHFNVFSDDVNIEVTKNVFKSVGTPQYVYVLDVFYSSYGLDVMVPTASILHLGTNNPQSLLRAPPFLS